jgi:16S rRNA (adenine1518-N6/adenine1519-N6)-dimethyltransferase
MPMAGQTLSEIRSLLSAAGLAPQHRFGQNFLIDLNLMRKLVDAANVRPADTILEVGAGTGSLTDVLLERGARVVAVEIDHGLQAVLRDRLGGQPGFTLVQGDALASKHRVNPLIVKLLAERPPEQGGAYKLVANLPYGIATPLLVDLLLIQPRFAVLAATVQREVGERLASPAGVASYGPVSVAVQTLADVMPIAILPPQAFWPAPQVSSLMVKITPRPRDTVAVDDIPGFLAFVQEAFQQRRKQLRRLVRDHDALSAAALFARAGVSSDARPAALTPDAWQRLYSAWTRRHR